MLVVCLEGCHGCGKSSLTREFELRGWNVLDEAFLNQKKVALKAQSLQQETLWMAHWFQRLLERQQDYPANTVYFADRSPFSAVFYSEKGHLLDEVIKEVLTDLAAVDIQVINVMVSVEKSTLWSRICARLEREPRRKEYREDDPEWMNTTLDFYEGRSWDYCIDNTDNSIPDVCDKLTELLRENEPRFPKEDPKALSESDEEDPINVSVSSTMSTF